MDGRFTIILCIGILFMGSGALGIVSAEDIENIDWNTLTADTLEANPNLLNSTFSEIPTIPQMPVDIAENAMVEGTGDVTETIELDNDQGDYSITRLLINGTADTRWRYQMLSAQYDGVLYTGAIVDVQNATRFRLDGNVNTHEQYTSYTGARGVSSEENPFISLYAIVLHVIDNNQTIGLSTVNNIKGSVTLQNRAYRTQGYPFANAADITEELDEFEWNQEPGEDFRISQTDIHEQYAGVYALMRSEEGGQRTGYAVGDRDGTQAIQYAYVPSGSGMFNILSEDYLESTEFNYKYSFEEITGDQMRDFYYQGITDCINNTTKTSAQFDGESNSSLQERKLSVVEKESQIPEIQITGSSMSVARGQSTVPASMYGKSQVYAQPLKNIITGQFDVKGGIIQRGIPYDDDMVLINDNQVRGNLTVGSALAQNASSLSGQETLVADKTFHNTSRMQGAWTIKSPATIPYIRWTLGSNDEKFAYRNEAYTEPTKVVKESAKADDFGVYIT